MQFVRAIVDSNRLENIPGTSRSKLKQIFKNHFNISVITKMEFLGFNGTGEKYFQSL